MNIPIVKFNNVSLYLDKTEIVKNIDFTINKGDFLNIVGPNGAGKTTLIKLMIKDLPISDGTLEILTKSLGYMSQKQLNHLNFPVTVCEFLYTGFKNQKIFISKADKSLMADWIKKMELEENTINKPLSYLSGGELQRIYFIRSLISKPEILILDEPASALDPEFRSKFYNILKYLNEKEQMTIIHVTHDIGDEHMLDDSKLLYIDQDIKFYGSYLEFKERGIEEWIK